MKQQVVAAMIILLASASVAVSQKPKTGDTPSTTDSLHQISTTLSTIAELLANQNNLQRSAMLLGRLTLDAQALTLSEGELQRISEQYQDATTELENYRGIMEEEERQFRVQIRLEPSKGTEQALQRARNRADRKIASIEARVYALETAKIVVENQVHDRKTRHDTLRDQIDRILEILEPLSP